MSTLKYYLSSIVIALSLAAPSAHAQFAVVDVGAIVQLVQQVKTMRDQLVTAQEQLTQARDAYHSMTGGRGMQGLLGNLDRNYLPGEWAQFEQAMHGLGANPLVAAIRAKIEANAILTPGQLDFLPTELKSWIEETRRAVALRQATTREALAQTSQRFQSIQQLINAIASATDQKAILDLQARIQTELGMMQNEQTKLQLLDRVVFAEDAVQRQREQESVIAAHGRFATRLRPTP